MNATACRQEDHQQHTTGSMPWPNIIKIIELFSFSDFHSAYIEQNVVKINHRGRSFVAWTRPAARSISIYRSSMSSHPTTQPTSQRPGLAMPPEQLAMLAMLSSNLPARPTPATRMQPIPLHALPTLSFLPCLAVRHARRGCRRSTTYRPLARPGFIDVCSSAIIDRFDRRSPEPSAVRPQVGARHPAMPAMPRFVRPTSTDIHLADRHQRRPATSSACLSSRIQHAMPVDRSSFD